MLPGNCMGSSEQNPPLSWGVSSLAGGNHSSYGDTTSNQAEQARDEGCLVSTELSEEVDCSRQSFSTHHLLVSPVDMGSNKLWELVMDSEAWRATVHGVRKSQTQLSDWTELKRQRDSLCGAVCARAELHLWFLPPDANVTTPLWWPKMPLVVVQSLNCVRFCDLVDCHMPGFPVLHRLPEFAQVHVHWASETI